MIQQTLAMIADAYRELSHRRLFWLVLILSGLVVAVFAIVGVYEQGITVFHWQFPFYLNSSIVPPELFYKLAFVNLGVKYWLAWIAAILALVSTASLIPDFIASGAVELTLSRPIARWRLFFTKYATGLLFVFLQVAVFTLASFLVIGLRGGAWEPRVFLAIPITVACFSFLYSVCVLLGILTRSAIASLLLTMLVWFVIFGIDNAESGLHFFIERSRIQAQANQRLVDKSRNNGAQRLASGNKLPIGADEKTGLTIYEQGAIERGLRRLDDARDMEQTLKWWHAATFTIKTLLPKTTETTGLLDRYLLSSAEMTQLQSLGPGPNRPKSDEIDAEDDHSIMQEAEDRYQKKLLNRSLWWILGTSFAFEAALLVIAGRIFSRRDF